MTTIESGSGETTRQLEGRKWLSGIYAPLSEEVTAFDLTVEGDLPDELEGRYLRNGPNPVGPVDPHVPLVHRRRHGPRRPAARRQGRVVPQPLGALDQGERSARRGAAPGPMGGFDTANTNVIGHAGRTFALVEAGARPIELTYDLDTIEHCDFDGTLPGGYTAHPKVDPLTGELHAIAYHWEWDQPRRYVVVGTATARSARGRRPGPRRPMSARLRDHRARIVVFDLPVTFRPRVRDERHAFPYRWDPTTRRARSVPLDGRGDDVRWFEVDPCYVFHPLNAYDDGPTGAS